jgi:hypothetical protein
MSAKQRMPDESARTEHRRRSRGAELVTRVMRSAAKIRQDGRLLLGKAGFRRTGLTPLNVSDDFFRRKWLTAVSREFTRKLGYERVGVEVLWAMKEEYHGRAWGAGVLFYDAFELNNQKCVSGRFMCAVFAGHSGFG